MKKIKISLIVLNVLSFVVTGVFLLFLGDLVPIHFGVDGTPDQFGSKYFMLLFPTLSTVISVIMLLVCKYAKVTENYAKYTLTTGVVVELLFLAISMIFSAYALSYTEEQPGFDMSKIMMYLIGSLLIFLGNYMPKVEKNRTLGLKTTWAKYNEVTWQKSQRFMAYASVISGVVVFISGLFFQETINVIILSVCVFGMVFAGVIASYIYYKQEKLKEN